MEPQDQQARRAEVGGRISRGIAWTALGSVAANVMRIGVLLALGRILQPAEFGVVAEATIVLVFVKVISDLGLGGALVQHRDPSPAHIRTAFTAGLLMSTALGALIFAAAQPIADFYRTPELPPFLRAIAGLVVLRGLGSIALQLSRRAMDFKTTTVSELAGYLTGSTTSIVLALAGAGAWALVVGYLVESAVATLVLVAKYPLPRSLGIDRPAFRELMRYGGGETVTQIANVVATQGDYLVVGRYLDAAALGFYTRAYELVRFPANLFTSVVGSVLFPGLARLQDDKAALALMFRRSLFATAVVLMPASAVLFILAPEVLRAVLGAGWDGAVVPFQIMVCGMTVRTNYKIGALVARARGDTYGVAATQVFYAFAVVVGALFSMRWGLAGIAVSTTGAMFLVFVALTWLGMQHSQLRAVELLACHAWPSVATALSAAPCWVIARVTRELGWSYACVLAAAIGAAACGFAAVAAAGMRSNSDDWRWTREVLARLRRKLGRRKSG